jgi:hypothetical protein
VRLGCIQDKALHRRDAEGAKETRNMLFVVILSEAKDLRTCTQRSKMQRSFASLRMTERCCVESPKAIASGRERTL